MRICLTGGVNFNNVKDCLAFENVLCVDGSQIVPKTEIIDKNFKQITTLCKETLIVIR